MRSRVALGIAAIAVAFASAGTASAQQDRVAKVGAKMSYSWQKPLTNGQGVKSLADLKGRPVVVEFWGTH